MPVAPSLCPAVSQPVDPSDPPLVGRYASQLISHIVPSSLKQSVTISRRHGITTSALKGCLAVAEEHRCDPGGHG